MSAGSSHGTTPLCGFKQCTLQIGALDAIDCMTMSWGGQGACFGAAHHPCASHSAFSLPERLLEPGRGSPVGNPHPRPASTRASRCQKPDPTPRPKPNHCRRVRPTVPPAALGRVGACVCMLRPPPRLQIARCSAATVGQQRRHQRHWAFCFVNLMQGCRGSSWSWDASEALSKAAHV